MAGRHRKKEQGSGHWRSTIREIVTSVVGILPVAVVIGRETGLDVHPQTAGIMAVVASLATALSHPTTREWLAANGISTGNKGSARTDE